MDRAEIFAPENALLDKAKEYSSPSSKYRLFVTPFNVGKNFWNYTEGIVFRYGDDKPLFKVQRNYSAFPFAFVEGHPNGHDYLLCGENYQGQTVLELDTGKRVDYLPEEAKKGVGFCWAFIEPSPSKDLIGVLGCYWGGACEAMIYDFSDPMSAPWPAAFDGMGKGVVEDLTWIGQEECKFEVSYEVRKSDGKPEYEMTLEESEETEEEAKRLGLEEEDMYEDRKSLITVWKK